MTKQPEALRLAEANEHLAVQAKTDEEKRSIIVRLFDDNAKELRRLHEEVKCEERRFNDLWDQFAALDKVNQELLAALKEIVDQHGKFEHCMWAAHIAREAIAKATGEQA